MPGPISARALKNLIPNRLGEVRAHCSSNQYDALTNPRGIVALAVAENKLMGDEVAAHINASFCITPWHLTYGEGSIGTRVLRAKLAEYVQSSFRPCASIPVKAEHIVLCNGAASALSNVCCCIGEPGDGVLVARPLYTGFLFDIELQSQVKPVLVSMSGTDPLSVEAVAHYEHALLASEAAGTKIRAIVLSNPHNPLGRPYSAAALGAYLQLCGKHSIHLISDEVFAQSSFDSPDFPLAEPFTSLLALDPQEHACDPALVHVLYTMSKDASSSGVRIGGLISPSNAQLRAAFAAIAGFTRPSSLAEHVWTNLLQDPSWMAGYLDLLHRRLGEAYTHTTARLREHGIPYYPACYTLFVWIDLSAYLAEDTEDAELALSWRLARAGVWINMGVTFGSEKFGEFRLTFATPRAELDLGLERMFGVLHQILAEKAQE